MLGAAAISRETVAMACSGGGHSELLSELLDSVKDQPRVWITQRSWRADSLQSRGETMIYLPEWERSAYVRGRIVSNLLRSARAAARRPKLVITTGAGLVLPFCLMAKLAGAKLVFIETPARLREPSKSGRLLGRFADRVLVQWQPMLAVYKDAVLCVPPMLEANGAAEVESERRGTVVAVGTHRQGFNRLLEQVDSAVGTGLLPEPVIAQGGVSDYRPRNYELRTYLQPDEMEAAIRDAQYVVCHGGSGIITAALRTGHRPLVMPRLHANREHVDDHQVTMLDELVRMGLAASIQQGITPAALEHASQPLHMDAQTDVPKLRDAVRDVVSELTAS